MISPDCDSYSIGAYCADERCAMGKLFLSLLAVCCVNAIAQDSAVSGVSAAPVQHTYRAPFQASVVIRHYDSNGSLRHTEEITEAFRKDGSWVSYRVAINGEKTGTRIIVDAASKTRTSIDPNTKSKITYHLDDGVLAEMEKALTECASSPSKGDSILDVAVVKKHTDTINNEAIDELLAPSLGCYPLQATSVKTEKSGKQLRNESIVTSIAMGEPDPRLFIVPSEYVERSPSEVLGKEATALNEVYKNAQH